MAGWKDMGKGGQRAVMAAGAVVLVVAAYLGWQAGQPSRVPPVPLPPVPLPTVPAAPAPQPKAPAAETKAQTQEQTPAKPAAGAAPQTAPDAAAPSAKTDTGQTNATAAPPATASGSSAQPGTPATAPMPPAFDVVRVAPDGSALIAGRAVAGASVSVLVDDMRVAEAKTDDLGKFVSVFTLDPSDKPRTATLEETLADGTKVASTQSVIIAPFGAQAVASASPGAAAPVTAGQEAAPATVPAAPSASSGGASAPQAPGDQAGQAGQQPASGPAETQPSAAPKGPEVLLSDKGGVTLLQQGAGADKAPFALETIAYSPAGDVQLSGHGTAGAHVRIYLDNSHLADAQVSADGRWSLTLPGVKEGVYTLRADEVDDLGKVTARVETPFKRESAAVLAQAGVTGGASGGPTVGVRATIITVQPGYTLWGIAQRSYGQGVLYVKVFNANREQIRDPNLIYPGQVFAVPGKP
ncbi:MAG: LysM peptidoglycan-binding domain-containing protein [Paracoccaceae bacterium]|nr:LysM peptidoglycan-binding domain-containing protein [Paracoccaceae bacterium]